MRLKRVSMAVALGAAASLALAACSPGGPSTPSGSESSGGANGADAPQMDGDGYFDLKDVKTQDKEIKVSVGGTEFGGFNTLTPNTYDTYSTAISDHYLAGWSYFGSDGKIHQNKDLGSYEKVSDNPLKIKYTINENAKWSDGTPITVADAILSWGTQSENLKDSKGELVFDNVSGELVGQAPKGPEGDPSGKEFTITYPKPNPDWEIMTLMDYPAHVVAKQAGMSVDELVDALRKQDAKKLEKAGKFWNTGWNKGAGKIPADDLNVVSGPYKLDSWTKGQSVTLKANPDYYGEKPGVDKLTFRFVDPAAMVQALQNGDLDVMSPQPAVDTLKQLEGLGNQVNVIQGDTMTWEHVDFNFAGSSVFKDDKDLRKAFAMCIPRQQIVDTLIKPLNPEAKVLNARDTLPNQEGYQDVVDASYPKEYDNVDVEGAKKILDEKGKSNLKVRIGYGTPNPRRANEVKLIKASCDKAGFNVQDISSADFMQPGGTVDKGDYDAVLFAWAGSGQKTSGANIYMTGKPQNFGKFSNKTVDEAFGKIQTAVDEKEHLDQEKIAEKALWDDMFGVPIFVHPALDASNSKTKYVKHTVTQSGISWNAQQWQVAE